MRKILIALMFVSLVSAGASLSIAQGVKIGVFDPQRVSEETEEGKRIQAELTTFRNNKQALLSSMEQEIKGLQDQLAQQALSLSADRKAAIEKEIQRKMVEIQSAQEAATRELQLEIGEAQAQFQEKLLGVVNQFGTDEGFTVILDAQLVAWSTPAVDVTTAIVDLFNQMVPPTPPAAPAAGQ
jgi:outer membrane protein